MFASTMEEPVLLIGSAHVVDLDGPLRATLGQRVLDGIAVELDPERADALLSEEGPPTPERRGGPLFLRLWGQLQRRLGDEIGGGIAGAEMRTAARLAKERQLPLFLIDDPIRDTIGRLVRSMSLRERLSLVVGGVLGLVLPSRLVERQLKDYSASPGDYLADVRRSYPQVVRVLLDERNEHMADRLCEIRRRGYGRVAAVVGDAHVAGLADALKRRAVPVETIALATLRGATGSSDVPVRGSG